MGLFGNRKADKKKKAEENQAQESAQNVITAQRFSERVGKTFSLMYRLIISANLKMNVYQVESGVGEIDGQKIAIRGYYDGIYEYIRGRVKPENQEAFEELFKRENLYRYFKNGYTSIADIFCIIDNVEDGPANVSRSLNETPGSGENGEEESIKEETEDFLKSLESFSNEAENKEPDSEDEQKTDEEVTQKYSYFEIRAERIPDDSMNEQRCIVFVRQVGGPSDTGHRPERKSAENEKDLADARSRKLGVKGNKIFFEYFVKEDRLQIHMNTREGKEIVYNNFLAKIDLHGDVVFYHKDAKNIRNAFRAAMEGAEVTTEVNYRVGDRKSGTFRLHRMDVAPFEDSGDIAIIIGRLIDIDDNEREKKQVEETAIITDSLAQSFKRFYVLDTANDLITSIGFKDGKIYAKESPTSLSRYIRNRIASGSISDQYKSTYASYSKKSFLDRMTATGTYVVEAYIKESGSLDFSWYSDSITKLDDKGRFVLIRKDISALRLARQEEFQAEEKLHFAENNKFILEFLAGLVEFRNMESGAHIEHVCKLTEILLSDVSNRSPMYGLTPSDIRLYSEAATLHDIGKITIPDKILNKPDKVTPEERAVLNSHTTEGGKIVSSMKFPGQDELKEACLDVALHHHERYDGNGYPEGLKGDENKIGVQAIGLADAYDALVSDRCYKKAFSHEEAYQMIINGACGAFNPRLLESFRACEQKLIELYQNAPDEDIEATDEEATSQTTSQTTGQPAN